ncbi:MAG: hypothetical protein LC624_02215 [Halobacteriales archaeon]|nr:hypothetical protein [Halobacteriales archaeon]
MQTKWILAVAVAMLVAPPALAAMSADVSDTSLPGPALQLAGGVEPKTVTCGASAPTGTSCTSGQHIIFNAGTAQTPVSHGFTGVNLAGVTATLESKLTWTTGQASGARTFRCNVTNGVIACMPGFGAFPPNGPSIVTHTCASYNLATTTPGGVGNWGCAFTFFGVTSPAPLPV